MTNSVYFNNDEIKLLAINTIIKTFQQYVQHEYFSYGIYDMSEYINDTLYFDNTMTKSCKKTLFMKIYVYLDQMLMYIKNITHVNLTDCFDTHTSMIINIYRNLKNTIHHKEDTEDALYKYVKSMYYSLDVVKRNISELD